MTVVHSDTDIDLSQLFDFDIQCDGVFKDSCEQAAKWSLRRNCCAAACGLFCDSHKAEVEAALAYIQRTTPYEPLVCVTCHVSQFAKDCEIISEAI